MRYGYSRPVIPLLDFGRNIWLWGNRMYNYREPLRVTNKKVIAQELIGWSGSLPMLQFHSRIIGKIKKNSNIAVCYAIEWHDNEYIAVEATFSTVLQSGT